MSTTKIPIKNRKETDWPDLPKAKVVTILASDIEIRPVDWLWNGIIPLGKLTGFSGDPGVGKSQIACNLAAHVSTGTDWPFGGACPTGDVLIISAEDGPEDSPERKYAFQFHWINHFLTSWQVPAYLCYFLGKPAIKIFNICFVSGLRFSIPP